MNINTKNQTNCIRSLLHKIRENNFNSILLYMIKHLRSIKKIARETLKEYENICEPKFFLVKL